MSPAETMAADRLLSGTPSIAEARRTLTAAFRAAGFDSAEADARLLVGHALGYEHAELVARADTALSDAQVAGVNALAARRLAHEPLARIRGVREFWGLPLRLNAATLVPRPETETVVEAVLDAIDRGSLRGERLRILDIGTGSGALLLALLSELPDAHGIGTDISAEALAAAKANAGQVSLHERCAFLACNIADALVGRFDVIVSNPPYIASDEIASLPAEVRDYDPRAALEGGHDGLTCYRAIAADVSRLLADGGLMAVELGAGQELKVTEVFARAGLAATTPARKDLAGIARALLIKSTA